MKFKRKHILFALGITALGLDSANAQQSGQFGQFQYNMLEINPAYAGYRETFNITLINRNQWVGFDGAPVTQTLTFNKPVGKSAFAYGGSITNDRIGPSNSLNLTGDIAVRNRFRDKQKSVLSFGVKASLNYYRTDLEGVRLITEDDPSFFRNNEGIMLPNLSFGAMLSGKTYFLGASLIKLIDNPLFNESELLEYAEGREQSTAYLTAGKIWKLNRQVSIYPAVLFKAQRNAPISGGAFLNFLLMSDFKIGGYYNYKEVAGALVQWQINRKFRIGYTFELPISDLFGTNLGSHELMINYSFRRGRMAIIYPKHF